MKQGRGTIRAPVCIILFYIENLLHRLICHSCSAAHDEPVGHRHTCQTVSRETISSRKNNVVVILPNNDFIVYSFLYT